MQNNFRIIVVNGFPRSGKDTFVEAARQAWEEKGGVTHVYSSIQPVFDIFVNTGLIPSENRNKLTNADRCALAEAGASLEKHYGFKTNSCLAKVEDIAYKAELKPILLFVFIREPELIKAFSNKVKDLGFTIPIYSVFISRKDALTNIDNPSDQNVLNYNYSFTLTNNDSLEQFKYVTKMLITGMSLSVGI